MIREKFVKALGEDLALKVEKAYSSHEGSPLDSFLLQTGLIFPKDMAFDDPFWACLSSLISKECLVKAEFIAYHGFTPGECKNIRAFIRREGGIPPAYQEPIATISGCYEEEEEERWKREMN